MYRPRGAALSGTNLNNLLAFSTLDTKTTANGFCSYDPAATRVTAESFAAESCVGQVIVGDSGLISSAQSLAGKGLVQNLPRKNAFYVQLSENRDCTEAQAHGRALLTSPDADPKQAIQSLLDDGVLQDEAFGHTVIADPHVRPDTLEALFHHWSKAGENAAAKILLDETIARLAKTPEYPMAKLIPRFADRASSQKQPFPGELAALDEAMKLLPLLSSKMPARYWCASELANQDPEGAAQIKKTNTCANESAVRFWWALRSGRSVRRAFQN